MEEVGQLTRGKVQQNEVSERRKAFDRVGNNVANIGQQPFFPLSLFLSLAKEGNVQRLPCTHEGTYADDCLVQRVTAVSCVSNTLIEAFRLVL